MEEQPLKLHQLFSQHIDNNDINREEIANHLYIHRSHLHRLLYGERTITDSTRVKLNEYLSTTFAETDKSDKSFGTP